MKLIAERQERNNAEPYRIYVEDNAGRHRVDLSLNGSLLIGAGKQNEAQLKILRPSGMMDRITGHNKILYLRIKIIRPEGDPFTGWCLSKDNGHTWGMVKKMGTRKAETVATLTIEKET